MTLFIKNAVLLALMLLSAGLAIALRPTLSLSDERPPISLKTMVPLFFGDWRELPNMSAQIVDPQQKELLEQIYSETLSRTYVNSNGYRIMLSIAYGKNQSGDLQLHKPEICYPAQGFAVKGKQPGELDLLGKPIPATRLEANLGQRFEPITYWTVVGDQVTSSMTDKRLTEMRYAMAGRIPDGATVERAVPTPLLDGDTLTLGLSASDFNTARAVAAAINNAKGAGTAAALDGRSVRVRMPPAAQERMAFLADIENLPLKLAKPAARVVLNARTGSVILNEAVSLSACAVAHGNLSVTISSTPVVSQPNPLAQGQTVQAERNDIAISQQGGALITLPAGVSLADVVKALNALGATPMDLLAILQAMKSAGALHAEIEVI